MHTFVSKSYYATFLSENQGYFQNNSGAQSFSAKVQGLLTKATGLGFPAPQGAVQQLADFVNGQMSYHPD